MESDNNVQLIITSGTLKKAFVLYYVMGVSVPSLHRESTDSLIKAHFETLNQI